MGNVGSTPINNSSDEGSTRLELAVLCDIKHVIEPLLETLSPRGIPQLADSQVGPKGNGNSSNGSTTTVSVSKEEQELLVIRIIERVMPLFADRVQEVIKEKIPSVVEMSWTRKNQNSGDRVNNSEPRNLELKFLNKPALLVLTGRHIKGQDGSSIKIALIDVVTGDVVKSGPEASAKVEIAVLRVDPDGDEGHDWTPVEFKLNIVTERKANLRKNASVKLKEGMGLIGEIYFPNRKIWTKKCQLRLGARIDSTFNGTRVKEAKSEPFTLEDCRNKRDRKRDHPSLSDEILGKGMSDKALNETVEHGLKCILDDKHLYYHPGSQPITGVVFNDVGQVMERLVESNYVPVADLSENEMAAQKLVVSAIEHWGDVITYDESSSNSLQIPSVPNIGTSHIVAGTDNPQPSTAPVVSTSDLIAAYDPPQPIPSYPGTISARDSIGMENLYSHNSGEGCFLNQYGFSEVPEQTFLELMGFVDNNSRDANNFDEPYAGQQTAENRPLLAGADRAVQSRRWSKMGHALIFSLRIKVVYSESVRKRQRLY